MAHCHYAELMQTPKSERAPQLADKYVLRMPDGMRDKITKLAKANGRSMNAEIVLILQEAIEGRRTGTDTNIDVDALADALAERLEARLKRS